MYEKCPNAARGLNWMFIAEILAIVSIPLMFILIGGLTALAGTVLSLVGLYTATHDDPGYFPALYAAVASLILSFIVNVLDGGILRSLLSAVSTVLGLFIVYQVVTITRSLMGGRNPALDQRGITVIKVYFGCTVISVVCAVLAVIPILNIIALVVGAVSEIVMVVGYVFYLMFLYGASKALA